MNTYKTIAVYADWFELNGEQFLGTLSASMLRGKEVFSFEYDSTWVENNACQNLDPDLRLFTGPQYIAKGDKKTNFGLFLDSSPDRWGRMIMRRREALYAKEEDRKEIRLTETDYLLGVYDEYRMGGLRFKKELGGNFVDDNSTLSAPPWTSLRELENSSFLIQQVDSEKDPEYKKWLNMLISPGASLGGARPKASVVDESLALWIAKFPNHEDYRDIGAWEMVANTLAVNAGIDCAQVQLKQFTNKHHTFLSKRFDRTGNGERIHFASAMTLLEAIDGEGHDEDIGYLDIANVIARYGAKPDEDLEQLWRRIVFNIAIANTDDHLRNHGFLLTDGGWRLSPAYDINPDPDSQELAINISSTSNALDLDLARHVANYFRLSPSQAESIISEVLSETSQWMKIAKNYNISGEEISKLNKAFSDDF
ncbi:HIPA PROTEIN [hydrothermal vent metagenome]|uniref:HIPA PROTEIN n=1 Tax=hydrothermal vent metagenome TaxID=652676 RepID=A0A3B0YI85_9ZZZZ